MKIAIWTVTRGAGTIAKEFSKKIKNHDVSVYSLKKFELEDSIQIEDFTTELTENFSKYAAHIFIMATGIVIRKISKLIETKDKDPAVLVIDEAKNFVISLLSGHLGGANKLARELAESLDLLPIITTSSDITGKIAVDSIAQKLNCELKNLEAAKDVTALLVDGKKVNLLLPKNIKRENENAEGIIICSNKKDIKISHIYPKNLVLGLGCRKDIAKEKVIEAINLALEKNNLAAESIKRFASIDIKKDEKGLLEAAAFYKREIIFIAREEILKIEEQFKKSNFVKTEIGVSSVSAPTAYLASRQKGKFIEEKFINEGVTVSIFEEENYHEE